MEACTDLLKRAVELDAAQRYPEALVCYEEGIQNLLRAMGGTQSGLYSRETSKILNILFCVCVCVCVLCARGWCETRQRADEKEGRGVLAES